MTTQTHYSWFAWLNYIAMVVIWGSTYFATVVGFSTFTPLGMLAVRFAIAAALCFSVGCVRRETFPNGREWLHLTVVGVGMLGVSNALVVWAMQFLPTGMAAVFMALTTLWLVVFGFERHGVTKSKLLGIVLGFGGVAILVAPSAEETLHRGGLLALFVAPMIWAWGTLYARRYLKTGPRFMSLGIQMLMASAFGALIALFTNGFVQGELNPSSGLAILYLSVFGSFLAYASYFYLVQVWEPARVGTFSYLTPAIAILLGTLYLNEKWNTRYAVGIVIVLFAVALVQRKK